MKRRWPDEPRADGYRALSRDSSSRAHVVTEGGSCVLQRVRERGVREGLEPDVSVWFAGRANKPRARAAKGGRAAPVEGVRDKVGQRRARARRRRRGRDVGAVEQVHDLSREGKTRAGSACCGLVKDSKSGPRPPAQPRLQLQRAGRPPLPLPLSQAAKRAKQATHVAGSRRRRLLVAVPLEGGVGRGRRAGLRGRAGGGGGRRHRRRAGLVGPAKWVARAESCRRGLLGWRGRGEEEGGGRWRAAGEDGEDDDDEGRGGVCWARALPTAGVRGWELGAGLRWGRRGQGGRRGAFVAGACWCASAGGRGVGRPTEGSWAGWLGRVVGRVGGG